MIQGVYKRRNIFYFRKRIPQDLLDYPDYLSKTEIKKSLKTINPKEANRIALNVCAELENKFLAIRQQREVEITLKSPSVPEVVIPLGRTHKLTQHDIDRIWVSEFERLEKEAVVERRSLNDYDVDSEDSEQAEAAKEARQDAESSFYHEYELADPQGRDVPYSVDWKSCAEDRLKLNGVSRSEVSRQDFDYLCTRLQDVNVEVLLRSIDVAQGVPIKIHDAVLQQSINTFKLESQVSTVVDGSEQQSSTTTIGEIGSEFLKFKEKEHPETVEEGEYTTTLRIFYDFFGEETYASEITSDRCYEFMDFLKAVPSNSSKKFDKRSLVELSELVKKLPEDEWRFLSASSQHKHFNRIVFMLSDPNDVKGLGLVASCPLRNQKYRSLLPEIPDIEKEQVTDEDLIKMLGSKKYKDHTQKRGASGEYHCGRYWGILLCMHHGMRLNEACQLLLSDVKLHEKIYYLNFSVTDEEGKHVKSLKTKASKRYVPLHSKMIELGFIDFCEAQRTLSDSPFLFPELVPRRGNNHSRNVGRIFRRLLDSFVDPSTMPNYGDKMTHTLRHRITNKLRNRRVAAETRYFLLGWSAGDEPLNAGKNYGAKLKDLPYLQETLEENVIFPDFDYGVLDVWKPT